MLDECQPDIRDRQVRTFFPLQWLLDETNASGHGLVNGQLLAVNRHRCDDGNVENADMGNIRFREPRRWSRAARKLLSVIPTDVRSIVAIRYLSG